MGADVRVRVLGPVTVVGAGPLQGRDRRVLGALVVEAGRVCPPDRLAEALYGSAPPATWRKVIHGSVGRLRQALGAQAIATADGGYRLELGDDQVDVRRVERVIMEAERLSGVGEPERAALKMTEALELVAGEPFADLDGWEPGVAAAAAVSELVRRAEEELVAAWLAAGQYGEALRAASEQVVREPLREQRWAALALAQYRAGRQGEALRTIHRARRVLADELGLDPGPELRTLERAILAHEPHLAGPPLVEGWWAGGCPYRGLAAYDVDDGDWFFGREREISDCLGIVDTTGFVAIVGASGSGKSSLARAGVAPALRRHGRDVAVIHPGAQPNDVLAGVVPGSVLVVDQLEELFVLCDDDGARARFTTGVCRWAASAPVVVTLRADHLGEVTALPELAAAVQAGIYLLGAMGEPQLRAAIEGPAAKAGLRLEPGLLDLLVRDVAGEPGALPLLSHALAETYERREGPVLTAAGYRTVGGVQGAVARAADQVVDALPPDGLKAARELFLRLVIPTDTGDPIRQRVPHADLAADAATASVLDALVASRLVITDQGTVEVAHEAVCRAWPRLRDWLDEDRDGIRIHQHLSRSAQEWEQSRREPSELYRNPRLAAGLEWAAGDVELNPTELAFLDASATQRDAQERAARDQLRRQQRTNRRLRGALAGVGVLLVLALIAGLVALRQRNRADSQSQRADAARLAAQSSGLSAGQLPLAQLLAVEAHRLDPSPASLSGLLDAVNGLPALRGFISGPTPHGGLALDPDGRTAITVAGSGQALAVFDVDGRRFERHVAVPSLARIDDVVITPDGSTLVACGAGELVILDPDGFQPRRAPIAAGPDDLFCNLAVSRDSSLVSANSGLVAFGVNGEIRVIRLADGTLAGPPIPVPGDVAAPAVFSADGRRIAKAMFYKGVRQWDVATGQPVGPTLLVPETSVGPAPGDSPSAVAYDALGRYLAVGDTTGRVRLFSTDALEPAGLSFDTGEDEVLGMAFSADGSRLAAGTAAGDMQIFDVERQRSITPLLAGQGMQVSGLSFSDGDRAVLASSIDGTIAIYDAGGRSVTGRVLGYGSRPEQAAIEMVVSPDGQLVAATHLDGAVTVWNLATGEPVGPSITLDPPSTGVEFSPDSRRLVASDGFGDITTWATDTWQTIGPSIAGPGYSLVPGLVFSPDGGVLAAAQEVPPTIRFYDAETHRPIGEPIRLPRREESQPVPMRGHGFSPDGSTLLTVELYASEVRIWDVATREEIQTLSGFEGAVRSATFDPTGTRIAVGETNGSVEIVDVESGRIIGDPYRGPQREIVHVQFSPDGDLLAAGVGDGTAQLWDTHTGLALGPRLQFDIETPYREATVRFSPDGDYLLTAGRNGDVIAWDLDPTRLAEQACRLAGRNLTGAEWERYLPDRISYRQTCNQWPEAPRK